MSKAKKVIVLLIALCFVAAPAAFAGGHHGGNPGKTIVVQQGQGQNLLQFQATTGGPSVQAYRTDAGQGYKVVDNGVKAKGSTSAGTNGFQASVGPNLKVQGVVYNSNNGATIFVGPGGV